MSKVLVYTPQKFLEDVRHRVAYHTPGLSITERSLLIGVPITYRPWPEGTEGRRMIDIGGKLLGATEPDGSHVYIFGENHFGDQDQMARSLVHELAHVLSQGNEHNDVFWRTERRLGLYSKPYERSVMQNDAGSNYSCFLTSTRWTNQSIENFVNRLPRVEWGPRQPFVPADQTIQPDETAAD